VVKNMPKYDKTGPLGKGPQTGRGFGPCSPNPRRSRGFGMNRGAGKFFGCPNWPQTNTDQIKTLADYRKALEKEIKTVKEEEEKLKKSK
jgi:hypothetical protein